MAIGEVQTFYSANQWHNRIVGTDIVFGSGATRGEAVWAGRARARKDAITHVICGLDGQVEQRHSYSKEAVGRSRSGRVTEPGPIILGGYDEQRNR
jgi:hypothetical protein